MTIDEAIQKARSNENSFKNNHKLNLTLKERSPYYGLDCLRIADDNKHLAEWLEELKEYQQLEEQGRLVKLPCKIGDTVWDNDYGKPCAYTITAFSFGECEEYICEPVTTKEAVFYYENLSGSITGSFAESEIGKSVFLKKSEAEAKLKELRGKA